MLNRILRDKTIDGGKKYFLKATYLETPEFLLAVFPGIH